MSPTLALTEDLLRRPSVSPEDHGCIDVICARLESLGFSNERLRFGPVENLWSRRGDAGPVLCFAGHTDVVPSGPREDWRSDPFQPVIVDGALFARGAADMKSSLAAMADTINPVKLYEYFALGKPVVSYKMRELLVFSDLLYLAKDKEDFLGKVEMALNERSADTRLKRKELARLNDWSLKAKHIEDCLLKVANI